MNEYIDVELCFRKGHKLTLKKVNTAQEHPFRVKSVRVLGDPARRWIGKIFKMKMFKNVFHSVIFIRGRVVVFLKIKCPICGTVFNRLKSSSHLRTGFKVTLCSRPCASKYKQKLQRKVGLKQFWRRAERSVLGEFDRMKGEVASDLRPVTEIKKLG